MGFYAGDFKMDFTQGISKWDFMLRISKWDFTQGISKWDLRRGFQNGSRPNRSGQSQVETKSGITLCNDIFL